jgi:hypothetical protein
MALQSITNVGICTGLKELVEILGALLSIKPLKLVNYSNSPFVVYGALQA